MSNFVDDNTPLAFPKATLVAAPAGSNKYLTATNWNEVCQAAYDLRQAILDLRTEIGSGAVIFDDSVDGTNSNVRTDRASSQSPIDNTKTGIINLGTQTLGDDATAVGTTGNYATNLGGNDNSATGDYSIVGGRASKASGQDSVALSKATATGSKSLALVGGKAIADGSSSIGPQSKASRKGQTAYSCGKFSGDVSTGGFAQTSFMVMRGETINGTPGETADLVTGEADDQEFTLEANHHYFVTVRAVAAGSISGGSSVIDSTVTFFQTYSVKFEGGTPTIITGLSDKISDSVNANGDPSGWALTASIQSSPDRLRLRLSTGSAPAVTRIVAKVEFVEVLFV